jgi:hypothetical protein
MSNEELLVHVSSPGTEYYYACKKSFSLSVCCVCRGEKRGEGRDI